MDPVWLWMILLLSSYPVVPSFPTLKHCVPTAFATIVRGWLGVGWFERGIPISFLTKMASLLTSCHMPATCETCLQKGIPHGSPEVVVLTMLTGLMLAGARRQCSMPSDYQCSEASNLCILGVLTSHLGDKGRWQLCSVPTCICKTQLPEKVLLRMVLPGPESSMVLGTWLGELSRAFMMFCP